MGAARSLLSPVCLMPDDQGQGGSQLAGRPSAGVGVQLAARAHEARGVRATLRLKTVPLPSAQCPAAQPPSPCQRAEGRGWGWMYGYGPTPGGVREGVKGGRSPNRPPLIKVGCLLPTYNDNEQRATRRRNDAIKPSKKTFFLLHNPLQTCSLETLPAIMHPAAYLLLCSTFGPLQLQITKQILLLL